MQGENYSKEELIELLKNDSIYKNNYKNTLGVIEAFLKCSFYLIGNYTMVCFVTLKDGTEVVGICQEEKCDYEYSKILAFRNFIDNANEITHYYESSNKKNNNDYNMDKMDIEKYGYMWLNPVIRQQRYGGNL
jgi:hypothetical protein